MDDDYRVPASPTIRRNTRDQHATTFGGDGRVGTLVENEPVVGDVAVVAQSKVGAAATVTGTNVAAHPVVVELVIIGTRTDGDTTGRHGRGRVQLVAVGRILRHVVIVHIDVLVVTEGRGRP